MSCTKHLTRDKAKAILDGVAKQNVAGNPDALRYILIQTGLISPNCEKDGAVMKDYDPVENSNETAVLVAAGYLTATQVKPHVWTVEPTEQAQKQGLFTDRYAHRTGANCDQWQSTIFLARYDHLDVTGIVEDGPHAKVDAAFTFMVTPAGIAIRKVARDAIYVVQKREFRDSLANDFTNSELSQMLGSELSNLPLNQNSYIKTNSFKFDRYDDGTWKLLDQ